jgi:large subunit ribosomal protein L5e
MPFVKVVKNKAYYKRYQVKYRRRREGKTDYYARRRLVNQDKNKYNSPKYRFVVRFSNRFVTCQVVFSDIIGDKVMAHASSKELSRYGLTVGLKNYAAAYCTGLLCARRLLTKLGMADLYVGNTEVTGDVVSTIAGKKEYFVAELDDDRRPFKALLDVGVRPTTTGARLFGAMKGATDGGLNIPHSEKRFPGYDSDSKSFDAETHRDHIMGAHVAEYMRTMEGEDPEKYQAHFSEYIKANISADDLDGLYESVHNKIREDPSFTPREKPFEPADRTSFRNAPKLNLEQRRQRVQERIAEIQAQMAEED